MPYCPDCGNEVPTDTAFCQECGNELSPTQTDRVNDSSSKQESQISTQRHLHPGEEGFAAKHAAFVGLLSVVPAIILGIITPGGLGAIGFLVGIPVFTYLGYQKPTIKSAFSRQAFWGAVMLLISPLMMIVHTAVFISSETDGGAEEAGAALGGTVLVLLAFFVGLPLAGVFYLAHKKTKLPENQSASA